MEEKRRYMKSARKKPLFANRVSEDIERAVVNIATEFPAYGQQRAANELRPLTEFSPSPSNA